MTASIKNDVIMLVVISSTAEIYNYIHLVNRTHPVKHEFIIISCLLPSCKMLKGVPRVIWIQGSQGTQNKMHLETIVFNS